MRCLMNRLRSIQSLLSLCWNVCRGLYRAAWRVAKSKKTHTAVISTGLALVAAVLLYVPAVLSYLFFYYKYLPEQAMTIPMYLQYGYVLLPLGTRRPGCSVGRTDADDSCNHGAKASGPTPSPSPPSRRLSSCTSASPMMSRSRSPCRGPRPTSTAATS